MTSGKHRFVRMMQFVLAAIVAVTTIAVLTHATEAVATARRVSVNYNLSSGSSTGNITPASNQPVTIIADQTGTVCGCDDVGSSLMTVVRSSVDRELVWNGFESNGGGLTTGFSPIAGTHIMYIDFGHAVDLEVSNSTSFHVHNGSSEAANGTVTLIW
jgi:hypothetical protein